MYLSMNFLTVPSCTWLHTQSVPDHTWCELSHWQLLALCMDPLPCMRRLSLPDYLHPTVRVHMATHWTSFPVDIVLMTPGAHWVQATTGRQDLLCKDYGCWWSSQRGHRYWDTTILLGQHNNNILFYVDLITFIHIMNRIGLWIWILKPN